MWIFLILLLEDWILTKDCCCYHPDADAVTTCANCNKNLCVDCKFPYYLSSHLCPICYFDYHIRKYSGKTNLLKEIFLGSFILLSSSCVFILLDYQFTKLPPLSLSLFIISFTIIFLVIQFRESFILRPRKFEEALSNKEEFMLSVGLFPKG